MTDAPKSKKAGNTKIVLGLCGLIAVIILVILGNEFVPEPFNIPSGSNEPTLLSGDLIFVSRYPYRKRMPERGDMVVFVNPHTGEDSVKRVVGLPGDRIQVTRGTLIINGESARRERIADYRERVWDEDFNRSIDAVRYRYRETLPNNSDYEVLGDMITQPEDSVSQDNTAVFQAPDGQFFVMGDNRDNSLDSRLGLGYVPLANIIGRVDFCYYSWTKAPDGNLHIRWDRMFRSIR